jgi:hypothetical protein
VYSQCCATIISVLFQNSLFPLHSLVWQPWIYFLSLWICLLWTCHIKVCNWWPVSGFFHLG